MWRLAEPSALQWLWLIPGLLIILIVYRRRTRAMITGAFGERMGRFLTQSISWGKRYLKWTLRALTIIFFTLALARPQAGKTQQEIKSEGVELMIVFDVSNSMLAEDVRPNRLNLAINELKQFVSTLGGDKVGLIAFAGSALLLSPLTEDKSALTMYLESLSPEAVQNQGTDMARALSEAEEAFKRGGIGNEDQEVRVTRVLMVISDGESHEEGALKRAEELADQGIRIYTFAVGTEQGGRIPVRDARGYLQGYKKDESGQDIVSKVSGEMLSKLAEAGHGRHYNLTLGGRETKMFKSELERLEKAEFDTLLATNYDEKYQVFLFLGILFALIDLAVSERQRGAKIWQGRFEVTS